MSKGSSATESLIKWVDTNLVPPMVKIAEYPPVVAVRNATIAAMPIIIVGSFLLLIAMFGQPWIGVPEPLIPALTPYSGKILDIFSLTMGIMALYIAFGAGYHYAAINKLNALNGGLLSIMSFLIIAAPPEAGALPTGFLGAAGIFPAFIAGLVSVEVYKWLEKSGLVIRMPKGVPPAIAEAFVALTPVAVLATLFGVIRIIMGINIPALILDLFRPIVVAGDNVFAWGVDTFLRAALWSVGVHGCATVGAIMDPLAIIWGAENSAAALAGVLPRNLPHIWVPAFDRITTWWGTHVPLNVMCLFSKSKRIKTVGWVALPAMVFCIIEPLHFGLPVVMNPIFWIPFVFGFTFTSVLTYVAAMTGVIARFFVFLPWATPGPIIGFVSSGGDLMTGLWPFVNAAIGAVIFWPFFKAFEKQVLGEEAKAK